MGRFWGVCGARGADLTAKDKIRGGDKKEANHSEIANLWEKSDILGTTEA